MSVARALMSTATDRNQLSINHRSETWPPFGAVPFTNFRQKGSICQVVTRSHMSSDQLRWFISLKSSISSWQLVLTMRNVDIWLKNRYPGIKRFVPDYSTRAWDIRYSCIWLDAIFVISQAADRAGTGMCSTIELRQMMQRFRVNLNEEEFYHLMSYFDKNMTGQVSYNEFLKAHLVS